MKIGPVDSGDRPYRPDEEEKRRVALNSEAQRRMDRTDKVEISSVARSLSEKASPPEETGEADSAARPEETEAIPETENRAEKIEQARQRIESGYYDSPDIKDKIARRIADDFAG